MSVQPIRPAFAALALTETSDIPELSLSHSKVIRSWSVSSSASSVSSTSSTYSRAAEDMLDRIAAHDVGGNIRLNNLDLTTTTREAQELLHAMKDDERFQYVQLHFFDEEKEDWKVSFVRSHASNSTVIISDSE
ncbi:uncharacterized protein L203_102602 [Cryptococcus depauperatus CBS 7841]|uniref:Uncharacterized protein n=1 Tax=Cryptococcus depauperatus CBS 7841 TaxID=1295531 RepID=A0AAJ8M1B8_9TREE